MGGTLEGACVVSVELSPACEMPECTVDVSRGADECGKREDEVALPMW